MFQLPPVQLAGLLYLVLSSGWSQPLLPLLVPGLPQVSLLQEMTDMAAAGGEAAAAGGDMAAAAGDMAMMGESSQSLLLSTLSPIGSSLLYSRWNPSSDAPLNISARPWYWTSQRNALQ